MPLEYDELEPIINEVLENVKVELIRANSMGTLDLALDRYGVEIALPEIETRQRIGNTILVLGDQRISKDDLNKLYKIFKLKAKNFEFVEYGDVTNFSFGKLIESNKYSDIFVGPVPHKAMGIGDSSGVIEYLQTSKEIPAKISILKDNSGELKISKKTFKKALEESNLINQY